MDDQHWHERKEDMSIMTNLLLQTRRINFVAVAVIAVWLILTCFSVGLVIKRTGFKINFKFWVQDDHVKVLAALPSERMAIIKKMRNEARTTAQHARMLKYVCRCQVLVAVIGASVLALDLEMFQKVQYSLADYNSH